MVVSGERKTAEERREEILDAALAEFAQHGFEGASTDAIARSSGISQPYLFRLFGTKKELHRASVERCFSETYEVFRSVSDGLAGDEALEAMGKAYKEMITDEPRRLWGQMQAYVACEDPDVCQIVRRGFGRLVDLVESKGVGPEQVAKFFAFGMLINVMVAMDLYGAKEAWAKRLAAACLKGA